MFGHHLFPEFASLFEDIDLLEDIEGQKGNRAQFIKDKIATKWRGVPGYKEIDPFLEKLAAVDPSPNGIYMPWMAKLILINPQLNKPEDLDRVGNDLRSFETHKRRIENKDINQYKSFDDLYDVIKPFENQPAVSPEDEEKQRQLEKIKNETTTIYAGPEGWVRIPHSFEAAKFFAQNTRWCTANRGMFDHYSKSDVLIVVYDKESKQRYQLHIESGQFANEADRNQGINSVPEWAKPKIFEWYKNNNPNLSLRHIMALSNFGKENLAKGTPHEALLDLMAQYNIA
jgi:hypothetical protein